MQEGLRREFLPEALLLMDRKGKRRAAEGRKSYLL